MLEKIRHHRFWIRTGLQIQHNSQVVLIVGFVVGVEQLWQLPRIDNRPNLRSQRSRFDSVRNGIDNDPIFAAGLFAFVQHPFAANFD